MGLFSALRIPSVTATEAIGLADQGAVLVDVREKGEWNAGHVPGAVHIPLSRIAEAPRRIGKGAQVLVICRSGNRSRSATSSLRAAGVEAHNVKGGMRAWQSAGGPVRDRRNAPGQVI